MCQDEPNVQLHQGSGEMRGATPAPKLLGQAVRFPRRALEDAVLVAVEARQHTMAGDDLQKLQQVAAEVLLLLDQGEEDRPGTPSTSPTKVREGPPSLQLVVAAAVGLQQHALPG